MGVPSLKIRQVELSMNRGGPLATKQWLGIYFVMELPTVRSSAIDGSVPGEKDEDPIGVSGDYFFNHTSGRTRCGGGEYSGGFDGAARQLSIRGPLEESVFEAAFPA